MDLPPLFFSGEYAYGPAPPASVDYAVEYPLMGLPKGTPRSTWRLKIFECFSAQDAGLRCCCAHCCCSIWTLNAAQKLVPNVKGEDAALALGVVAQAINDNSGNQGGGALGAAAQAGALLARAEVRRQVFKELYGQGGFVSERAGMRYFYLLCCPCCAAIQEVDGIQTWAKEKYGHTLVYGPLGLDCACCGLETVTGIPVSKVPYPKEWDAPPVALMER